jgi:hypothetical protein
MLWMYSLTKDQKYRCKAHDILKVYSITYLVYYKLRTRKEAKSFANFTEI